MARLLFYVNKKFAWVSRVLKNDFFQKMSKTEQVVPKMVLVCGVLPAFFLSNQALLSNFQNRPGGHVYLEGHAYLAVKSRHETCFRRSMSQHFKAQGTWWLTVKFRCFLCPYWKNNFQISSKNILILRHVHPTGDLLPDKNQPNFYIVTIKIIKYWPINGKSNQSSNLFFITCQFSVSLVFSIKPV